MRFKKTLIIFATALAVFAMLRGIALTEIKGRVIDGLIMFMLGSAWIMLFVEANKEVLSRND